MRTRPIPSTGEALPVIGCGTWRGFDVGTDAAVRTRLTGVLDALADAGGTVIDTSPMYGSAEAVTGALLAASSKRQPRPFLATKIWTRGKAAGEAQLRQSFRLLRTDRLDLIQIHNLLDWRIHLATARAWQAEGKVRYIGVTHYTASAHAELEAVLHAERLDFVQLNYALDDRAAEQRLLPCAAERGVAVLVNRPFGGGGLLRALRAGPLPSWAAELGCVSWAQLLLKFVLSHKAVTCAIPGTGDAAHMRANALAGHGNLPDAGLRARLLAEIL